ncbi:hypothetical protein STVA_35880 [Allostella vacuolata]|nr:hypothetical protein STVA_35880 [Stella vacuolata]
MSFRRIATAAVLLSALAAAPAISDCLAADRAQADVTERIEGWHARAEAGDRAAQYRLAYAYQDGIFVAANSAAAARLYRAAAEQGHSGAQAAIAARHYEEGDFLEARRWATEAARQGSAEAAYLLGRIHARGDGVEIDPAAAFRWFLQAELRGHVVAAHDRRATARLVPADERRAITLEVSGQHAG